MKKIIRVGVFMKIGIQFILPVIYSKVVLIVAPVLLLFKSGEVVVSGKKAYWSLQVRAGEKFLNSSWHPENSVLNPLRLPLESIKEIFFPVVKEFAQFNPSIVIMNDSMTVVWRISNNIMNPVTNDSGEAVSPLTGFRSGIGMGELHLDTSTQNLSVSNASILIHFLNESRLKHHQIADQFGRRIEFDDPRFVNDNPNLILLHGRHVPHSKDPSVPNFSLFLYDTSQSTVSPIKFTASGKYEKNWVPLAQQGESLHFLRSTFPLSLVRVDKESLVAEEEILLPKSDPAFHNGSNVVAIDEDLVIRVVRQRVHVKDLRAIHISHIVVHDTSLTNQTVSRPFIFRGFGYEICNSIAVNGDKVYFAWGENDQRSFLGWISKSKLREWIAQNS